jgi:hypothetical protein
MEVKKETTKATRGGSHTQVSTWEIWKRVGLRIVMVVVGNRGLF